MRRNRLAASLALSCLVVAALFSAGEGCSSTDAHPDAGTGGVQGSSGSSGTDSSTDSSPPIFEGGPSPDADTDSGNNGCHNMFKDGEETDVDCGGSVCAKCVDGKACVKASDCAGGSCINLVCKTTSCSNGILDGDETDVDCGGKTCPQCNIGKHCNAATDCNSATCTTNICKCPSDMVEVSKAIGNTSYCVDGAEVSKGQYYKFITASVPVTTQPPICSENNTFVPRGAWPPSTAEDPLPAGTGLAFSFSLPVHYVDWCDAYAYCKWRGKQMCGEINKEGLDPVERNDAGASAWYNACSAQGTKGWPYGVTYATGLCNDLGQGSIGTNQAGCGDGGPYCNCLPPEQSYVNSDCTYGAPGGVFQDDGIYAVVKSDPMGNFTQYAHTGCQGGSVGLYQMSGNVGEWEDTCTDGGADSGTAGATQNCGVRGGSYNAGGDSNQLRCDAVRDLARLPPAGAPDPLADVGIRCCVY